MRYKSLISAELYRVFDPGEPVKKGDRTAVVREFMGPMFPGEETILFLDDDRYGITDENVVSLDNDPPRPSLEDPESLLRVIADYLHGMGDSSSSASNLAERIHELLNPGRQ